ncbi:MAG TPA: DDE transposase, partial [Candidatus Omnitrophota bacterium]|nr:DDE transposase [Candidatus Omnitrophota bacterium]
TENTKRQEQYLRRKQRERNLIEGDIGNAKEHYGLSGIRYHYVEGSEIWVRLGFLAKNLKIALARVS